MSFSLSRHNDLKLEHVSLSFLLGIVLSLGLVLIFDFSADVFPVVFWEQFWSEKPNAGSFLICLAALLITFALHQTCKADSRLLLVFFAIQGIIFSVSISVLCLALPAFGIYQAVFIVVLPSIVLLASQFWILCSHYSFLIQLTGCVLLTLLCFLLRIFGIYIGCFLYSH